MMVSPFQRTRRASGVSPTPADAHAARTTNTDQSPSHPATTSVDARRRTRRASHSFTDARRRAHRANREYRPVLPPIHDGKWVVVGGSPMRPCPDPRHGSHSGFNVYASLERSLYRLALRCADPHGRAARRAALRRCWASSSWPVRVRRFASVGVAVRLRAAAPHSIARIPPPAGSAHAASLRR